MSEAETNADGNAVYSQNYINGFVYRDDFTSTPTLSFISMNEGRVVKTGSSYDYQYFLKDHLGSTRVVFSGNTGTAIEKNFYYPYGATVKLQVSGEENKYRYNGKELEDDNNLNWYYYGARYYDPTIGRWHTMDPMDELNSPYIYAANNPITFVDPNGKQVWIHPDVWTKYNNQLMASDAFNKALLLSGRNGDYKGPLYGRSSISFRLDESAIVSFTMLYINGKGVSGDVHQFTEGDKYFHTTVFLNNLDDNTINHEVGGHYAYNSFEFIKYLIGMSETNDMFVRGAQDYNVLRGQQNNEIGEFEKYPFYLDLGIKNIKSKEDALKYIEPWPEGK